MKIILDGAEVAILQDVRRATAPIPDTYKNILATLEEGGLIFFDGYEYSITRLGDKILADSLPVRAKKVYINKDSYHYTT